MHTLERAARAYGATLEQKGGWFVLERPGAPQGAKITGRSPKSTLELAVSLWGPWQH